jgi:hypothetical protein
VADELRQLAQGLGIPESRLVSLRHVYLERYKRDEEVAEAKLLEWLKECWDEARDRKWLLSRQPSSSVKDHEGKRHYGYTESPSEALSNADEGAPPYEIEHYRHSRQARARFLSEKEEQVANLFGACREVRAAVDGLDAEMKKSISRDLWVLKGKLDRLEQKLRRRTAA